jgi:cytoskeletal protein CcmA (bactofilin family)
MWNRRKEEEPTIRPSSPVPTQVDLTREGIPMSTTPTRVSEPGGGGRAAVGKSVVVNGDIYSREDLYVDGEVTGNIEVHEYCLTVGPNGRVKANIKAREVILSGTVHGDISAVDKVDIRRDAKVAGDIKTGRIVIEDGAYFKGSVDIIRQQTLTTTPSRSPEPAKPSAQQPASGNGGKTAKTAGAGQVKP